MKYLLILQGFTKIARETFASEDCDINIKREFARRVGVVEKAISKWGGRIAENQKRPDTRKYIYARISEVQMVYAAIVEFGALAVTLNSKRIHLKNLDELIDGVRLAYWATHQIDSENAGIHRRKANRPLLLNMPNFTFSLGQYEVRRAMIANSVESVDKLLFTLRPC